MLYDLLFLLDQLLSSMISQNLISLLATGDSTVRNTCWWKNDWVTREGTKIESPRCSYRLSQLISDPIDLLQNSSSLVCTLACILIAIIILIFKTQFKNRVPTILSTVSVGLQLWRFIIHQ